MQQATTDFLKRCDEATDIDHAKTRDLFKPFMDQIRAAIHEASDLRGEFVGIAGDEDDLQIYGIIFEMDQKLGALMREADNLLSQTSRVQAILRECRQGATRIRDTATKVATAKVELAAAVAAEPA